MPSSPKYSGKLEVSRTPQQAGPTRIPIRSSAFKMKGNLCGLANYFPQAKRLTITISRFTIFRFYHKINFGCLGNQMKK